MNVPSSGRVNFGELDALRGIAALLVALLHAQWINALCGLTGVRNAYLMVDFFFVLSGFIMYHTYGTKLGNALEFRKFVVVRLGRLYPLHLCFLMVFLGIEFVEYFATTTMGIKVGHAAFETNNGSAFLANLLLAHSLGFFDEQTFNTPSWSISTEFYAYLVFAVLFLFISGARGRRHASTIIAVVGFGSLLLLGARQMDYQADYGFLRCLYGFFLGVLAYSVYPRLLATQRGTAAAGAALLALTATVVFLMLKPPRSWADFAFPVLSAFTVLAVALAQGASAITWLSSRPMLWLGKVSYSIYMVHMSLVWFFSQLLRLVFGGQRVKINGDHIGFIAAPVWIGTAVLIVYVISLLVLSAFTYRYVEEPCRNYARRLAARMGQQAPKAVGAV
ncbi:MAG: acyltransferase [Stagnimonas sp.]|nr:acyltransferase [Stagnimonas sp.]